MRCDLLGIELPAEPVKCEAECGHRTEGACGLQAPAATMRCRECHTEVDLRHMGLGRDAEEDGIEIGYTCPGCSLEFFAVVKPEDFDTVN